MAASQMSAQQKRILTKHSLKLSYDFTPEGVIVLNGWLASGGCFQECWPWPVSLGACVCSLLFVEKGQVGQQEQRDQPNGHHYQQRDGMIGSCQGI